MEKPEEKECCPKFDPAPWDGMSFSWEGKRFIKAGVSTFFHMPLNFGPVIRKLFGKAGQAVSPEWLCLSDHVSKWRMDIYMTVNGEVAGAENVTLSGRFLSKVYEGKFSETGKWCEDFANFAADRGLAIRKWYMWYTTCPKCARKHGKNYVVIVAEVGEADRT